MVRSTTYFRRPPFWKFCHPERAFSRISDALSFLDLEDLRGTAPGFGITASGPGVVDTGMNDVDGAGEGIAGPRSGG